MATKTGRHAILEQFLADGLTYMFGNPGTVEQGFLDALSDYPQLSYVLTLQESIAVMIADGHARATQRPALVQLHSTPGVGNAIGALYQAKRGHSPLVVIGGDAGIKYQGLDAQMAGDVVAFARPVTKWSTMVMDPGSLLRVLRRAIKIAATPPRGPVYVCLPMDVLDRPAVEQVRPTSIPVTRTVPDERVLHDAAVLLAGAERPLILVGDGVAFSGAQGELTRVAELLGAEVWEADAGEVNMGYAHPLYQGMTGHMFGSHSLPITSKADAVLICGTYVLPEVFPEIGAIFDARAKVVHIDLDAYEIAKNHPVDLGMVADPRLGLARLADVLGATLSAQQRAEATRRAERLGAAKQAAQAAAVEVDKRTRGSVPLHMARFMEELAPRLPDDAVIFDEALTNSPPISRYKPPARPGQYFLTRGGSLGVGIPGAIGVKLANRDKIVVGFTGDGGAMYTIQALWTAARHDVGAKFVVCNNGSYRLLQLNLMAYWQTTGITPHDQPICFDLSSPAIRFTELARGLGVDAARVERPEEIAPAVDRMLADDRPFLIDLVLEGDCHPGQIGVKCGQ